MYTHKGIIGKHGMLSYSELLFMPHLCNSVNTGVVHATAPPRVHTNAMFKYDDFMLCKHLFDCCYIFVGLEFSGGEGTNYARKFDSAPGTYASHLYTFLSLV